MKYVVLFIIIITAIVLADQITKNIGHFKDHEEIIAERHIRIEKKILEINAQVLKKQLKTQLHGQEDTACP
jgi:hypothetical protein